MEPVTKTNDVFISYAYAHKTIADAVCAALEQNRIRCWIAPRDVLPGEPFTLRIIRALNESRLFVLVFGADTNESDHIKNEVGRAISAGLPIVVFRVEAVVPTEVMDYYLSWRHWVDAIAPPIDAHLQKLVGVVRALLAIPSLETAPYESEQRVADLCARARIASAQEDWSGAVALLEQAEALLPGNPQVAEMLQAVERDRHVADLRRRAQKCLERHDWAGAVVLLEEAARLAPGDADLAASLAVAFREEANQRQAEEAQKKRPSRAAGYDVFISYRRDRDAQTARLIRAELGRRRFRVFLDVEDLRPGHFDEALLQRIREAPNFVVILSPDSLERCANPDDWLRREVACALAESKTVIPIMMPGFAFPASDVLPEELRALQLHHGVNYSHEYFEAMIANIVKHLAKP